VLFGDDVPVPLDPRTVPAWLRPGPAGRSALGALDSAHSAARAVTFAMPGPVRRRLEAARSALFGRP
jgi:hypothetical protein